MTTQWYRRWTAALLLLTVAAWIELPAASRQPVRSRHNMVVSASPEASQAGLEVLRAGGTAVDAAVAVGFALAVTLPEAGNLGGGGFMVILDPVENRETTIDYREMAPAAAHRDMYLDQDGNVAEGRSTVGYLASGVPGSVAGMHMAWERYGKLPWRDLLQPAIRLARDGFTVSHALSRSLKDSADLLSRFPESRRIFLKNGELFQEGDTFRQPELARTLELIAEQGPQAFYDGEISRQIVAEMESNGGNITAADLRGYLAKERPPVRGTYRGYEVVSMGPPSSGGLILIEMLNILEGFPLANLGFHSSDAVHLTAEAMRRAFADRAEFLGDPDFSEIPASGLIDKGYARQWADGIHPHWATLSSSIAHGKPYPVEAVQTTHYSVVDARGGAVACTTTLNGGYGSGVTVSGAGFLLNNEMDDFSSKPGVPNAYGLIQGEANSIAPAKRPLSAMTPTLVKKDGKLFMVLGSPGGPTIINTVLQIILNVVDFGMDIQEAVDAPRLHHQWLPDRILAEPDALVRDVEENLRRRGHKIELREKIGDAHSIAVELESGVRLGAPDPRRGDGTAAGN